MIGSARRAVTEIGRLLDLSGLRRGRFLASVALGTVAVLAGALLLALSGYLICRAAQQPPILSLGLLIVAVRAVAIVRPGARYAERLSGHDLAFRTLGDLRAAIFEHIEPLAPAELDQYRDGELLSRMVADIDALQDLILRVVLPAAVACASSVVVVAAVAWFAPGPAIVLALGLIVAAIGPGSIAFRVTTATGRHQAARRAQLTADLVEVFTAAPELWLNGADATMAERIATEDCELVRAARRDALGAGWAEAAGIVIAGATMLGVAATATAAVGTNRLDALLVVPLTLVTLGSFDAVLVLAVAARQLPEVLAAGRRVLELVDRSPAVVDPVTPVALGPDAPRIEVRHARIGRGPHGERLTAPLDLTVAPHERVVLTGPSGVGKSTLLLLVTRFLERREGDATLDDQELRDHAQQDVRRRILLVEQDPHVFNSTIRENLAFARPGCRDDEIEAALVRARLGSWVAALPEGLDTVVGEHGRTMSGGERRRLALARAYLADPLVLLLDEPTAHLDATTAGAVLDDLWAESGDRSVVLVTHGDAGPFGAARVLDMTAPEPPIRAR